MAPRIAPPSRNAAAQALLELYQSTERRIIQEIARKRTQGYVDYAELAALRRVRKTIQQMVDKSAKYVPLAIEHEFYKGEGAKKGYENALGMTEGAAERDRVAEQLVDNLMGEVQEMAQTAYQSAEAQVLGRVDPGVYRQSVLRGAIVSETMGRGSLSTVEEVMRNLQQAGITAFVDRAGREWSLSAYGSMAVRTTVRQAQVSAILTADDHDLWKIKEIGSTCPLCAVYEGRVYSKSGLNPNYPPLAAAFGKMDPAGPNDLSNTFLNIHPSCLHSLVRWTEDYKTDEEIRQAREFSSFETNPKTNDPRTEKQIEAYRNKERQRAAYRRDVNQFDRYTKAGVEDFPKSMATFLKHKQADDEKYRKWVAEYRKVEKPKEPVKPPVTVEGLGSSMSEKLMRNYEDNRIRNGLNLASAEELERSKLNPVKADFTGLDVRSAESVSNTLTRLLDEYESPLQKIGPMEKTEAFMQKSTPAQTSHNYSTASAEMKLNPLILQDYDSYIDRVAKAVGRGQFPRIPAAKFDQYVPTHEFAHTLLTTGDKLPTAKTNWAGMDYSAVRRARKEIEQIFSDYKAELSQVDRQKKPLLDKLLYGSPTEQDRKELLRLDELKKSLTISDYAGTNPDEFMAEAFTDARLGSEPSKYSKQVETVLRKHFGRKK